MPVRSLIGSNMLGDEDDTNSDGPKRAPSKACRFTLLLQHVDRHVLARFTPLLKSVETTTQCLAEWSPQDVIY